MATLTLDRAAAPIRANRDLLLVVTVIGILMAILLPMSGLLMDGLLALNITFSLLVLLTAIYVRTPLDFSAFPSLLLVMTLFRLALNIATTRLILGRAGSDGELAAGSIIQVFGNKVTAGDPVVGFIIFAVIVIIQFVVITKGATRIAEVAARFTLDKMPGQQLSIDADLNAGLIDEEAARRRRERIGEEADFYGAMDGASKFVRGDAIAGILITLINIIGGLIIGMAQYGMDFSEAVEVFTKLTIGDGLVSQVPALLVSVAAALVVTRQSSESDLGGDLVRQLFTSARAVAITAAVLILLLPLGLPAPFLVFGASVFGFVAYTLTVDRRRRESAQREEEVEAPAPVTEISLPPVDPLELEVGYGLVNLVDGGDGGDLLHRIGIIREQIAGELGMVVPPVRIRDNMQLGPSEYVVKLRGEKVASGSLMVDRYLAMDAGLGLEAIEGVPTKEPAFGIDAVWVSEEDKGRAEAMGYTVVDVVSVLATHLTEVIRDNAAELLTREETTRLIERIKGEAPAVVQEVTPDVLKVGEIQKVLQRLLREKVSVRDLESILESLADWGTRTKDTEVLTEYARNAVSRTICSQYSDGDGKLHVITVDPRVEEYVQGAIEHTERGSFLKLGPEQIAPIAQAVTRALDGLVSAGHPPVLLTSPQVRAHMRRMLLSAIPGLVCLSYGEISRGVSVESAGVVRMD